MRPASTTPARRRRRRSATAIAAPIPRLAPATSTHAPRQRLVARAAPPRHRAAPGCGEALEPVRGGQRVALHVLGGGDRRHRGRDAARALLGQPLVGAGLEELADPEPAGVARGAQGREDVVGADRLVAVGDRRLGRRGRASRSCAAAGGSTRAWPRRPGPRGARRRSGRRARSPRRRRRRPRSSRAPPTRRRATSRGRERLAAGARPRSSTASPSARDVVISTAGEVGPCSAWPSRSSATSSGSALSSAMIATSVGPASRSMPTWPNSWRLASAT